MTKKNGDSSIGTALVPITAEQFPVLAGGVQLVQTIRQNMGGEEVSPADLNRIKVPSGGGTTWEIPSPQGDVSAKTLEGIIVHITRRRAYWTDANPTGAPPSCSSADCVNGIGNPGGECARCPMNVFGSARKADGSEGRGKACKERKLIFFLREGQMLPDIVDAPPGSLRTMRKWQLSLGANPFWSIKTQLELVKISNKDGIGYAEIHPTMLGKLPPEAAEQIMAYARELQAVFSTAQAEWSEDEAGTAEV